MSSIRGITPARYAAYDAYRAPATSGANRPKPAEDSSREQELTRQLDTRLTDKINRIRQQIAPTANSAADSANGVRHVDILA
jgi:hypothetical protein